jgi:SnoaL-like domain
VPQERDTLQYLIDRAAIQDVITRYFLGLDRADRELIRSCFTDDVEAAYDGRQPVRGSDNLVDSLGLVERLESGEIMTTTHFMGNFTIERLEADTAYVETYGIAFLACVAYPEDRVRIRSLRYLDDLRRVKGDWLISKRVHTLDWVSEIPATFAVTLTTRLRSVTRDTDG